MELLVGVVVIVLGSGIVACIAVAVLSQRVTRLERRIAALESGAQQPATVRATAAPPLGTGADVPAAATPTTVPALAQARPVAATETVAPAPVQEPVTVAAKRRAASADDWEARIGGRWLNRIGLTAVVIGVVYFLQYAIDNDWIGPAGQVAIGFLAGAGIVAGSAVLAKRGYAYFADGLTGLGAVVLYLSAWAASSHYELIAPVAGFVLMVAITAGILAVAAGRSSSRVAAIAAIGGGLTPALIGSDDPSPVPLFSYLAAFDAAFLLVGGRRGWRQLAWLVFAFTEVYFLSWITGGAGGNRTTMATAFATLFFAEFFVLPSFDRSARAFSLARAVVAVLNPVLFLMAMHTLFWPDHRWTLMFVTLALAALHLGQARLADASAESGAARALPAALALGLLTAAVPIRLSGAWLTCAWAVEAAAFVWIGLRTGLWPLRALGLALFAVVMLQLPTHDGPSVFLWNRRLLTAIVTVASAAVALATVRRFRSVVGSNETPWFTLLGLAANVIVVWALTREAQTFFRGSDAADWYGEARLAEGLTISLLWLAYAVVLLVSGVRARAAALRWQALALVGLTTLKVFVYDLSALSGFYRIASSIALGLLLLGVSFLYQRRQAEERQDQQSSI